MPNANQLSSLSLARAGKRRRESSYDRSGGNKDYFSIRPGDNTEICKLQGAGAITHIWMTMATDAPAEEVFLPRKIVLRMYWDGEQKPSVEAPIGDFFGMGHGLTRNYTSAPLMMSPEDGKAFNSFFRMPFADGARITIESEAEQPIKFYFYIDYEQYDSLPAEELRFHAKWHRECPTEGITEDGIDNANFEFGGKNTTGEGNYVILDAVGRGHYVGCNLNIHNLRDTSEWNWYGEGDDMIFIDGEPWPPTLHGTGMEDYFNTAWCPQQEVCTPYHGIILGGGPNWSGKISTYRYHILDPIMFEKSLKVTIEHGHNNHRSDDYSSTAYWYQAEPHQPFPELPKVAKRLPLPDIKPFNQASLDRIFGHQNP
ncbi:glycoside hydrolase family 172 protein [Cohnella lubricantis]|uniref:DUF2961 domain-containing protein n=1 Tax=Cohnella lubricantis TaxID=2163172 RepID=A0A841TIU9_9BACL|nr:glycoside hydrolase family 172 protein [Cohnella lubricantis]MBB6678421.1 DUF2961 domain-containing protein [Cohnella lubricantis]MBP2116801.1 hypothetical protein [Cohnella lubricantis]